MNGRYLPNWLYDALPYAYLAAGVLAMIALQNRIATLSGLMLVAASCIVGALRLRARPKLRKAAKPAADSGIVEICWKPSYESGHRVIDEQRRRLFGLCNALVDAVLTRKPKPDVELMLHDLFDHIVAHFESEERLLDAAGHPLSRQHKEVRQELLARAGSLQSRYRAGQVIINDLIGFVTYDIITGYIIGAGRSIAAEPADLSGAGARAAEAKRREVADTVLKMARDNPDAGGKPYLSIAALDRLTPGKELFNSYPHVWQRICVFAPEPTHLEKYISSLLGQDGDDGLAGFTMQAMKEIGDIYTQNLHFLPKAAAA